MGPKSKIQDYKSLNFEQDSRMQTHRRGEVIFLRLGTNRSYEYTPRPPPPEYISFCSSCAVTTMMLENFQGNEAK